ncbi:MAG: hypothetical protein ACR2JE_07905 [Acidobacteriaceae bacterium]
MAISIHGSLSTLPSAASSASTPSAPVQPDPKAAPTDTVRLSQAAQVRLLKQQGQMLSQIANNLSIPVATVDGYLGIQPPKPAAIPAPAQPPAPAQGPSVAPGPPAKG